jgi:hypothetical protein
MLRWWQRWRWRRERAAEKDVEVAWFAFLVDRPDLDRASLSDKLEAFLPEGRAIVRRHLPYTRNLDLHVFAGIANGGMQASSALWDVAGEITLGIKRDLREADGLLKLAKALRDGH